MTASILKIEEWRQSKKMLELCVISYYSIFHPSYEWGLGSTHMYLAYLLIGYCTWTRWKGNRLPDTWVSNRSNGTECDVLTWINRFQLNSILIGMKIKPFNLWHTHTNTWGVCVCVRESAPMQIQLKFVRKMSHQKTNGNKEFEMEWNSIVTGCRQSYNTR